MKLEPKPGDIYRDNTRGDYFRIMHVGYDGQWEIASSTDLAWLRTTNTDDDYGEWFPPETLAERITRGEVEPIEDDA